MVRSGAVLPERVEPKKGATHAALASRNSRAWEYSRNSARAKGGWEKGERNRLPIGILGRLQRRLWSNLRIHELRRRPGLNCQAALLGFLAHVGVPVGALEVG